jgi:predicted O-methyltransferase YrrM
MGRRGGAAAVPGAEVECGVTCESKMAKLLLKAIRYVKCYSDLTFGGRPKTLEATIDYCVDRPVLMGQERSEILQLAKLLKGFAPQRSLEIGTNYGGTLFLLCTVSPPGSKIISVDLPRGPFGGGYPRRKIPLFRKFRRRGQELHLVRADSHSPATKKRILTILGGEPLDYLFVDGDHTYRGVQQDFEMYSPLVRRGGMVVFHDIVTYNKGSGCEVEEFWRGIKDSYRHAEIVEPVGKGSLPLAVTRAPMHTAGLGVLYVS